MLIAHILPASSSADATAACEESLHKSDASFVIIATARHFTTGAIKVDEPPAIFFTVSESSFIPFANPIAAVTISAVTHAPKSIDISGFDFFIRSPTAAAVRAAAADLIISSIAITQRGF